MPPTHRKDDCTFTYIGKNFINTCITTKIVTKLMDIIGFYAAIKMSAYAFCLGDACGKLLNEK